MSSKEVETSLDERNILASVSASLQDQTIYEEQVIRDALVPQLLPATNTFPNLDSLAPTVEHVPPVLKRIRAQLSSLPTTNVADISTHLPPDSTSSSSGEKILLQMKEQILLAFLSQRNATEMASVAAMRKRKAAEAGRQHQPPEQEPSRHHHHRVPMMKRKRIEKQEEEEQVTEERKQILKTLRFERKQRREQRKRMLTTLSDSDDGEEHEWGKETKVSQQQECVDDISNNNKTTPTDDNAASLLCPLCEETLTAPLGSDMDAILSHHMEACQHRRRSRRRRTVQMPGQSKEIATAQIEPTKRKQAPLKPIVLSKSLDDIDETAYEDRVDDWIENGLARMKKMKERDTDESPPGAQSYPGGLSIPAWINNSLFGYQREGIRWMWEKHEQEAGLLVGDEMGLGKTVQVSAFLGCMASSRKLKAVLIIAPATMLQHWLSELAVWAPGIRRILIHQSGETDGISRAVTSSMLRGLEKWLRKVRSDRLNEAIDASDWDTMDSHSFCGTAYAIVTTYENLRRAPDIYTEHNWSYIVLDEAQKIRNPDADVTLACKRIRTPHRLALSGTPIQNDLKELWSLFDFVFPGRLGTLPAFEHEFAEPIRRGGYSNATPMQVQLAYRCALMLKELISPYLLRRQKRDVKEVSKMPSKTEHVLFCRLSSRQRTMYEAYLKSDEVARVIRGTSQMFAAVTMLRKICNHPDLVCNPDQASFDAFVNNGYTMSVNADDESESELDDELTDADSLTERSGKLEVLSKILPLWHKQGHRVLIFCQWRKMLNIIQRFLLMKGWKFGRLDGNTNVSARQKLVDDFNADTSYFCMLCTTRTGGVGLNLTGANRIVLYDPDWNPQTDAQARERAWRFGQERDVTIYRLITAGSIEEKIYHRQIFKTALTNRVLQDPRQRRLFSQRDLRDLFTLRDDTGSVRSGGDGMTETAAVTKGVGLVDPEEDIVGGDKNDNSQTLKKVLKSKGLAGVFDHHFVEADVSRKNTTVREMEHQAKRVARDAARALRESVADQSAFAPTWTGSNETKPIKSQSRFGSSTILLGVSNVSRVQQQGSAVALLDSLRQRKSAIESGALKAEGVQETKKYTAMLARLKKFIKLSIPTTDEILEEFKDLPETDAVTFRMLLKSVAEIKNGRWRLKGSA